MTATTVDINPVLIVDVTTDPPGAFRVEKLATLAVIVLVDIVLTVKLFVDILLAMIIFILYCMNWLVPIRIQIAH